MRISKKEQEQNHSHSQNHLTAARLYSSIGRALDCKAGGRGFDSRGRTNTQGLNITEK